MTSQMAIICVDDEPDLLRTLKVELKQALQGCFIETAESGQEALELLQELQAEQYEVPLFISDYIMPIMKGDELLKKVHVLSPDTLNIMLTGQATIEAVAHVVNEARLYRYIAKPLDRVDLHLTVQRALQTYLQNRQLKDFYRDLEQKVAERSADLTASNQLLAQKNAELSQLDQEKNEFLGVVVHDLKNPLSNVLGLLQTVEEELSTIELPAIVEKNIKVIRSSAQLMSKMISNLLDVNRIESGQTQLDMQTINIRSILDRLVTVYTRQASQKRITVDYQAATGKFFIHVDEHALYQVLDNLLSNAVKYTAFDKHIEIKLYADEDKVYCEICDQGEGLSDYDQQRLFGKFMRLSPKPTAGEQSTGLGLYIVKKLVDAMQGEVLCDSCVGQGSKFTVAFPQVEPPSMNIVFPQ